MSKLWEKGYQLDKAVEKFTVSEDVELDKQLVVYDCLGSIAHAAMLHKIKILSKAEFKALFTGLSDIIKGEKDFVIHPSDEDVHTAVENYLTKHCGEAGKKLHAARSRNDQVTLDIRLYIKQYILKISNCVLHLCDALHQFAEKHSNVPIPGRTHMQRAMPSSLGLWAGAYLESLLDDMLVLQNAYLLNDQCPLGFGASYGSSIDIDRQYTSDLLGFAKVQNNALYGSNSRGKFESIVVHGANQVMSDLSRLANDLILFSMPELGYIVLPKELCSGSSLMPQKHNPCALELMRAKAATVSGYLVTLFEIIRALPSGYCRDLQETKMPLMRALETTEGSLCMASQMMTGLQVDVERCKNSFTKELFATDEALSLVKKGVPFREAYKTIATHLDQVKMQDPVQNILSKTHLGTTGNLNLTLSVKAIETFKKWYIAEHEKWETVTKKLQNFNDLISSQEAQS